MPLDGSAGFSEDTRVKQRDLSYVLGVYLRVAQSCMQQPWAHKESHLFDLTAGPGMTGDIEGSPLVGIRMAARIGLPFRGHFFEQDDDAVKRLSPTLRTACGETGVDGRRLRVIPGDHNRTVPWYIAEHLQRLPRNQTFGLAYGDGNGRKDAPFGPLETLAKRFKRVDLLLNVNATIYKRGGRVEYLFDRLNRIEKKFRLIREPVGIHQWTMLLLTNWAEAPELTQIGFHRLDSPEGRRIAEVVNFSKRELGDGRPPFVVSRPTGPMPSTYATRDSSPSEPRPSHAAAASVSVAASPARPSLTT